MTDPTKGRDSFVMGSSLVRDVDPQDKDVVVLCKTQAEAFDIAKADGFTDIDTSMEGDPRFVSVRYYSTNYILVWQLDMFFRFKAFTGALELLQIKDKAERIRLSRACLYGEIETVNTSEYEKVRLAYEAANAAGVTE